ncbi:MAG: hypothetical protein LV480_02575 [Methylacidiphilales bacterium]|nr:hypothetical protein [Candidatus Methylacidiphilales bacterium]
MSVNPKGASMIAFRIVFLIVIISVVISTKGEAQTLYSNSGNNTTGFVTQYGNLSYSSNGTDIIGATGGGYVNLPVTVSGNFQMSYDFYGNAYDAASFILFMNSDTSNGVQVLNCA